GNTVNNAAWSAPITTGGSCTVTAASTGASGMALVVLEINGQAATPVDVSAEATATSTAPNSGATGTPASASELAIGLVSSAHTTLSARTFSPSLAVQTAEITQANGSFATVLISDGPLTSASATTFSATVSTSAAWIAWCLIIQAGGAVAANRGFFASIGHPGPRVPANTFRSGGY